MSAESHQPTEGSTENPSTPASVSTAPPFNEEALEAEAPAPRRGCLGRLGCGGIFFIWLFFVSLPTFLLIMAFQGEIGFWHGGDMPEPESHPMLLVRLVMDIENQGFSVTSSSVSEQTETAICVQTHVRFLLWEGDSDDDGDSVSYCDCYTRASARTSWLYNTSTPGSCGE
jgi:hypothetical protein